MIYCPHCGGETRVKMSRPQLNYTRRRRVCLVDKSHVYTTFEVLQERFQLLLAAEKLSNIVTQFKDVES